MPNLVVRDIFTNADINLMVETRRAPRHRVLKAGTIEFGGGGIDCTVRDLSTTGAALRVTSAIGIPDNFTLVVLGDRLRLLCHVVWRKEFQIGVAFD
jgi:PilZ domain